MTKEFEAYEMGKSLGNYLKTEVIISSGTIIRKIKGRFSEESAGYNVKITISNTAPVETNWPAIVFTGVGLVVGFANYQHRTLGKMKNEDNLHIDLTNAPQDNPFLIKDTERVNGEDYLAITSDEARHGYVLFPGCSITYEMSLTTEEYPDVNKTKFWVEGNVSRRHLLHFRKELVPISIL